MTSAGTLEMLPASVPLSRISLIGLGVSESGLKETPRLRERAPLVRLSPGMAYPRATSREMFACHVPTASNSAPARMPITPPGAMFIGSSE